MCILNINDPMKLFYRYNLRGDTLLNLVLIYATLIEFTQKTEDFEVKVIFLVTTLLFQSSLYDISKVLNQVGILHQKCKIAQNY